MNFGKSQTGRQMDSLIGPKTLVEGKILSEASLRIEGAVKGNIESSGDIMIGEKSVIESDIHAREVIISGTVFGNVQTEKRLLIKATGQLVGDANAGTFVIEEGGVFQGISTMAERSGESKQVMAEIKSIKKNDKQAAVGK